MDTQIIDRNTGTDIALDIDESGPFSFDAAPDAARALTLRKSMNRTLQASLASHFAATNDLFPEATERAQLILDGRHAATPVNSATYTRHWMLASAIAAQDPGRVAVALARLGDVALNAPVDDGRVAVTTLAWDDIDAELMMFLASPEGPRTRDGLIPQILTLPGADLVEGRSWVESALPVLADLDEELSAELATLVQGIRLFAGRGARGITSTRCFGTILLRVPSEAEEKVSPFLYFLDHITHETSHLVLHGIMNRDRLILNGHGDRFAAPMRRDPRPLFGIYHAVFVLSRIIRVLSRYEAAEHDPLAGELRTDYIRRFTMGLATLEEHAVLTSAGRHLLNSCGDLVTAAQ